MQFHQLPDDTCRLLATWMIAQLDCNGVFYADPNMVRSLVFTRRGDVSLERIEQYLQAMEDVGLIIRFEAGGEIWQHWPGFDRNQPGLRKDRETTNFPPPPASSGTGTVADGQDDGNVPDECRQDDGNVPDECRQDDGEMYAEEKGREEKLSEVKGNNIGANAPSQSPPTKPQKRKPTGRNAVKAELTEYFSEVTGIPLPALKTDAQRKSSGTLWWSPVLEIAGWFDDDLGKSKRLIEAAVARLREANYTISTPKSIFNTARAICGEWASGSNGGGKSSNLAASVAAAQRVIDREQAKGR